MDSPAEVPFGLPSDELEGRVAVVTGASRGLGAGLAERFAAHGVRVARCARTLPSTPDVARGLARCVDVANAPAIDRFADEVVDRFGAIDLWVNNAGVLDPIGPLRTVDATEAQRALEVNIGGVVHGSRAFLAHRRSLGGGGTLINISSGAARSVYQGWAIYGATKAAVDHLTEIIAAEEPEVTCRAVAPGVVDTGMQALIRAQDDDAFPAVERFEDIHRMGAWNSPAWIADHLLGLMAGTLVTPEVVYRVPDEPRG